MVRMAFESSKSEYDMSMPAVVVETGISTQDTIPASVSKAELPIERESMEVIPEEESYSIAPPSMESPLFMEVVARLFVWVLIVRIGVAVVEVAIVQAYILLEGMVEVEDFR